MRDPKAILLRAFGDLSRSKVLYRQLSEQFADDQTLSAWMSRMEERIAEDLHWVTVLLSTRFGVKL